MSSKFVQKSTQIKTFLEKPIEYTPVITGGTRYILPDMPIRKLHYHTQYEIGVCVRGHGIWFTPGNVCAISTGDVMVMPAGVPHYSRSIDKCECEFIFFNMANLFSHAGINISDIIAENPMNCPVIFKKRKSPQTCELLKSMIDSVKGDDKSEISVRKAAHRFAIFILDYPNDGAIEAQFSKSELFSALKIITGNFSSNLTLNELAATCNMSPNWFLKKFREIYGTTPIKYLNDFRCTIAAELLVNTYKSITEISGFCGYNSPSDLLRHFKRKYKISPMAYRKSIESN